MSSQTRTYSANKKILVICGICQSEARGTRAVGDERLSTGKPHAYAGGI
jgi:hypothetical protein